jgi:hypothetical protein
LVSESLLAETIAAIQDRFQGVPDARVHFGTTMALTAQIKLEYIMTLHADLGSPRRLVSWQMNAGDLNE